MIESARLGDIFRSQLSLLKIPPPLNESKRRKCKKIEKKRIEKKRISINFTEDL
jgi:hypothetical protein